MLHNPARHRDSALALLAHTVLIALLSVFGGFAMAFFRLRGWIVTTARG